MRLYGTAEAHALSAAAKLRASNRAHLVTRAFVLGILRPMAHVVLVMVLLRVAVQGEDDAIFRSRRTRRREDEQPALVVYSHSGALA